MHKTRTDKYASFQKNKPEQLGQINFSDLI